MADLEKYNGGSLESLVFMANGEPRTTSLIVAERFGKQHKNVLRDIGALARECPEEFNRLNFEPIEYTDGRGRSQKMYELTRDGFTLLAMGFTGKEALQWKTRYIEAFNRMEKALREQVQAPLTPSWRIALEDPRERLALYEKAASISERYGCPDPRSRLIIEDGIRNTLREISGEPHTLNGEKRPEEITIMGRMGTLGYPNSVIRGNNNAMFIGKAVKAKYIARNGVEPPTGKRYIDGAQRDVCLYTMADIDISESAIHLPVKTGSPLARESVEIKREER